MRTVFGNMTRFAVTAVSLLFLFAATVGAVPEGVSINWPGGGEGKVVFDGTTHAAKGFQCDACHVAGLFQTKKDADKITMAAMKQGKFCGACHNGKKAFSATDPAKCLQCHKPEKKRP